MAEFTKEQLIAEVRYNLEHCFCSEKTKRLMEIALAALTAEPAGWTDEVELRDVDRGGCGYLFTCKHVTPHADERRVIKLYRLPLLEGFK
ncbi:hypothetical protein [Leclercia sp. W17]|uniref:hypothetical protein n=1 Tax=Leclercia sp. W17 TaxID=2282309 RepID=UPI000DF25358|nr:hypothetical protein [Leclercia sp. W17]AXF65023.1 hypothetical protein DVA44_13380 [Leclercia sp. W17]